MTGNFTVPTKRTDTKRGRGQGFLGFFFLLIKLYANPSIHRLQASKHDEARRTLNCETTHLDTHSLLSIATLNCQLNIIITIVAILFLYLSPSFYFTVSVLIRLSSSTRCLHD